MAQIKNYFTKDIARFFLVLAIFLFLFLLSDYLGFAAQGFDHPDIVATRNFYFNSAIVASLVIILGFFFTIARKKGDEEYGQGIGFSSPGKKPHLSIFKRMSILQISWLFLIIFLILGFLNFNQFFGTQSTYTGVGSLSEAQQFTPGQNIVYQTILIPIAENLPAAALLVLLIIGLGILARRRDWSYGTYFGMLFVTSMILGGLYGYGMHKIAYAGNDISLQIVFGFWAVGMLLTLLTGVFTVFWEMHLINNLYLALAQIYNPDVINFYMGIIILLLSVGYFIFYRKRLFGQKIS